MLASEKHAALAKEITASILPDYFFKQTSSTILFKDYFEYINAVKKNKYPLLHLTTHNLS